METINIMVLRHAAFYSPLIACISGGFLKQEGLEATYAVQTPENTVANGIKNNSVDVAQSAVATSFMALEESTVPDFTHFAQINQRDGFFITSRSRHENFQWSELKGKKVLVDHFFQPLAMFNYALSRHGMSMDDIEVIDAGDVAAIDKAFRDGTADYVHQQGPAAQQLEKDGLGFVTAAVGDSVGPVAFSSLCASPQWLQTDMAKAFMRAYKKACRYVLETDAKQLAREEQSFFPDIDQDVLTSTIATYQQLGCWSTDVEISHESYEKLLDVFDYSSMISQRYPYDQVITPPPLSG